MTLTDIIFGASALFAGAAFFWLGMRAQKQLQKTREHNARLDAHIARMNAERDRATRDNFFS